MTVPSKSKNAPTAGPAGPARTSATASASDTVAHVRRGLFPARCQLLAARLEEAVILGQLQGGGEQLTGQRFRSVQAPLQQHLPAHSLAFIQEGVALDGVTGIAPGQAL